MENTAVAIGLAGIITIIGHGSWHIYVGIKMSCLLVEHHQFVIATAKHEDKSSEEWYTGWLVAVNP
jgi:hypothetical protein